ncbi:MAG: RluA family pseudouridine synthase [Bacilli bacterium]|nr:RluA family pseudouridine synthase [Bacilli bacterium]
MDIRVEKNFDRLDQYLVEVLDISRSKIQKLVKNEKILLNGVLVSASHSVKEGDNIFIDDDLDFTITVTGEDIPVDVVYEDDDLLVINKKSGMVVHPAPGNYTGTLVNALIYKFNIEAGKDTIRPGIVHRIDKDTSGLMLVAKNDFTHEKLANMIKDKKVVRKYIALVDGVIKHETGTIDAPIGRDPDNRQKMKVIDMNSKDSITHFTVIKRFKDNTLIECLLDTGRTHQIRVHLNYIGYPIHNDPLYGKRGKTTDFGQFLHSASIKFTHPRTNKEMFFEVDAPLEFTEYLNELE